jgi:hypothetical protein
LDRYTGAPTADEMARINDLAKQLRALIVDVNKLLEEEVPRLNKQINDAGLQISNPGDKHGYSTDRIANYPCASVACFFFLVLRHARVDFV